MKKKLLSVLAVSLLAASLGACATETDDPATGGGGVIGSVFKRLTKAPLALTGSLSSTMTYGSGEEAETYDNGTYELKTVLDEDYFFCSTTSEFFGEMVEDRVRYDRGPYGGETLVYMLSPFTNQLEALAYTDYVGQYIPFDSLFSNPFLKAAGGFTVSGGKLVLSDASYIDSAFLSNVVFGGVQARIPLTSFEIGFDKDYNPTTLDIVFSDANEWYSQSTVYSGTFVDASEIEVDPIPTPRVPQQGQEKLQAIFDSLQGLNYTVEFSCSVDKYDYDFDEETGEEIMTKVGTEDSTVTTYITPDGYFYEFGGSLAEFELVNHTGQFADHGEYETPEGLVEFQRNEDGSLTATRTPRPIRTVEKKFGDFWKYNALAFDVHEDGTFTLGNEKYFDNYLRSSLMTDGTVYSPAFVQNLVLSVDEEAHTLYYRYSDEQAVCEATIKDIGTTILPVDTSKVVPFTAPTSWDEYEAISDWNARQVAQIDFLTNNHREAIPYVYTPYDYEKSMDGQSDWEYVPGQGIVETIIAIHYIDMTYQCDTCDEAVTAYNSAKAQIEAAGYFAYDVTKDAYYWKDDEIGVNLMLKIAVTDSFKGQLADEKFNYGIVVYVENLDYAGEEYFF